MEKLVLILFLAPRNSFVACMESMEVNNATELPVNSSEPNKDMYVIHAMVYQVGILTNKTDNETANLNTTGNQEAVTFYHTNGSQVDLSHIANPLLTNVTAQSMVGIAPMPTDTGFVPNQLPWSTLNNLTNMSLSSVSTGTEPSKTFRRSIRAIDIMDLDGPLNDFYKSVFKREVPDGNTPVSVSIHKGSAVIPEAAGVQSIAIPPLLTQRITTYNNLSNIPVPIPNTSVVHYAKINTLVTKP